MAVSEGYRQVSKDTLPSPIKRLGHGVVFKTISKYQRPGYVLVNASHSRQYIFEQVSGLLLLMVSVITDAHCSACLTFAGCNPQEINIRYRY